MTALYFKTEDLDERCERKIADFMDRHCGGFRLPIPTDDLIRMIEVEAEDLDMYADLPKRRTDTPISLPTGSPVEDFRAAL